MTDYKDDIGSLSLERGTGPSMNDEMSQRPSLDITRQQELDKGSANLEQITNSLDGQLNTLLENIDIPNSQKQYLKEEMIDEIYKQGGENAKVTALHYSEESGLMHAEVNHFLDAYVDVKESLNQRSTFLEQPAVTQSEESTNIPSQTLDSNIIQNEDGLSRHEQLQISQEKINEISSVYENRLSNINQELSTINEARQIEGYWEQSQEIINIDMDRAEQLLSQRQNLYEILDRTPDEQQTYLDNHPEFDLVLNERDYDKVQTTLDDLFETMPKAIKLEDNPDDYKVGVWDSVTESINDTLQQADDGLALATLKRTGATAIGAIAGAGDFVADTGEGLYHLADSSANYLWGNAVGAVDYLSGHTLSDNFEYVRNVNIHTNQTHDQIVDMAKATYDMGISGIAESGVNYVGNSLSAIGEGWEAGDVDKIRSGTKGVINTATFVVPATAMTKAGAVNALNKIDHYMDASKVAHTLDKIEDVRVVDALSKVNTPHIEMLLSKSEVPTETLAQHLKNTDNYFQSKGIDSRLAEEFLEHGKWPEDVRIPKHPDYLTDTGQYKWPPQDGFKVDPITQQPIYINEQYVLKVGEVIDRYGAETGTFVSPINKLPDGSLKPYNYDQRALPYVEDSNLYNQYIVKKDMNNLEQIINDLPDGDFKSKMDNIFMQDKNILYAKSGEISPTFGSVQTGIQYKLELSIKQLIDLGILEKL